MRRACSRCIATTSRVAEARWTSGSTAARVFSSTALRHPRVKALGGFKEDVNLAGSSPNRQLLEEASSQAGPSSRRPSHYPHREVQAEDVDLEAESEQDLKTLPTPALPPNEQYIGAWTSIGIPPIIAKRLLDTFPHIQAPTPAQRAFILSVFRGRDVYLKDHMGRGKTLAIAIAVATLSYRASDKGRRGVQVVVLLPSTHMVHQVERDLLLLDPSFAHPEHPGLVVEKRERLFSTLVPEIVPKSQAVEEDEIVQEDGKEDEFEDAYAQMTKKKNDAIQASNKKKQKEASKQAAKKSKPALVLLATPKDLQAELEKKRPTVDVSRVDTVIIDEPDSMLPALPHRHNNAKELAKHPINRHPPPLVHVLHAILNIRPGGDPASSKSKYSTFMDYENKRPVQTVWTSGTLDSALRRLARTRAWVRPKEHLVDLDFSPSATPRHVEIREQAMIVKGQQGQVRTEPISTIAGVQPEHYALTVDAETGDMDTLQPSSVNVVPSVEQQTSFKGSLSPCFIESLALVHSVSPPPTGTYALAVPPEGISLDLLSEEISSLGIPSLTLRPETIHDVSALEAGADEDGDDHNANATLPPILVARRSAVPGLHLPKLHTIYLLGGLDLYGGGRKANENSRVNFYDILAGRVGRLGTEENGGRRRQRIISMVIKDSADEQGLGELFFGRLSMPPHRMRTFTGSRTTEESLEASKDRLPVEQGAVERRFPLHEWDLEGMRHAVEEQLYRRS